MGSFECYTSSVRERTSQIVAAVALLICLGCPILEMFDHWDHTAKTGSDSEYTFVALASCIGLGYAFAAVVSKAITRSTIRARVLPAIRPAPAFHIAASTFIFSIPISPPPLLLRI